MTRLRIFLSIRSPGELGHFIRNYIDWNYVIDKTVDILYPFACAMAVLWMTVSWALGEHDIVFLWAMYFIWQKLSSIERRLR